MSYRDRTEHRPLRSCLTPHVGRSPADPCVIERLAEQTYHEDRGIYFTKQQLASMSWDERAFIESQARRFYGPKRG